MRNLSRLFGGLVAARLIAAGAQAVLLLLLARLVDLPSFAFTAGLLGVMTFFSAVTDLGVTTATTRASAAAERSLVLELRRLNSVIAVVAAVLVGSILAGAFLMTHDFRWISLLPLVIWIFSERIAEYQFAFQVGAGSVRLAVLNLVVRKSVPTAVLAIGFLVQVEPLLLLSTGYAIGGVGAVLVGGAGLRQGVRAQGRTLAATLRGALPFWLNSVGAQARQMDVATLGQFAGSLAAASYAPAARLIGPLRLIPTTLAQAALPHMTRAVADNRLSRRLMIVSLGFSVPVYGLLAIFAGPLIDALLGADFSGSVEPLRILLLGLVLAGLASLLSSSLQAARKEWRVAVISIGTAIVTLVLVAILGQIFGAVGSAAAISLGYAFQLLALYIASKR